MTTTATATPNTLVEGEGQERKFHPTCEWCGVVLPHLLITAAEWPASRGTWCCEDCASSGRLEGAPTRPVAPVEEGTPLFGGYARIEDVPGTGAAMLRRYMAEMPGSEYILAQLRAAIREDLDFPLVQIGSDGFPLVRRPQEMFFWGYDYIDRGGCKEYVSRFQAANAE